MKSQMVFTLFQEWLLRHLRIQCLAITTNLNSLWSSSEKTTHYLQGKSIKENTKWRFCGKKLIFTHLYVHAQEWWRVPTINRKLLAWKELKTSPQYNRCSARSGHLFSIPFATVIYSIIQTVFHPHQKKEINLIRWRLFSSPIIPIHLFPWGGMTDL